MSDLIADSRDIVVQVFIGITPSIYMFGEDRNLPPF